MTVTMGIDLLRAEQVTEARPYLWRAFSQQKFNLRTLAALTLSSSSVVSN